MLMTTIGLLFVLALITLVMHATRAGSAVREPVPTTQAQIAWYRRELAAGRISASQFAAIRRELLR